MQNNIKQIYHLSCPQCLQTWWSQDAFPEFCPFCGIDRRIIVGEKKMQNNLIYERLRNGK